ncbi:hypothetical protein COEREDRAFT_11814 [Coemansia reversa NRRL 1564]|uniref:Uncharacterized protein n=1 Tax=Coemansia reversa (strain ATCC 12441 / NRRL 1564) TaxID=763665 RepID=A0A2G5B212_COERN|nr:hypothetical protein COEREDRAFT_11814 [Coemansia reversa NRRL 1564]|eukprot:PIA13049.1 hypothetical protein COEREDRAFT_11814 [Coemansia reversa NRRL 1564]
MRRKNNKWCSDKPCICPRHQAVAAQATTAWHFREHASSESWGGKHGAGPRGDTGAAQAQLTQQNEDAQWQGERCRLASLCHGQKQIVGVIGSTGYWTSEVLSIQMGGVADLAQSGRHLRTRACTLADGRGKGESGHGRMQMGCPCPTFCPYRKKANHSVWHECATGHFRCARCRSCEPAARKCFCARCCQGLFAA